MKMARISPARIAVAARAAERERPRRTGVNGFREPGEILDQHPLGVVLTSVHASPDGAGQASAPPLVGEPSRLVGRRGDRAVQSGDSRKSPPANPPWRLTGSIPPPP